MELFKERYKGEMSGLALMVIRWLLWYVLFSLFFDRLEERCSEPFFS